ncbi:hypothetical protein ACVI1J_010006 [Bradyrhizobium diazoefficiens]
MRDAGSDPFDGSLYVFRAKRADRIKIVWWDGSGVCLYLERLEKARFCWPRIGHHRVQLNAAQLMALVDGMDWKRVRTAAVKPPIDELQNDLDGWVTAYNETRPHQGRWCYGKTPMQTFLDALPVAREKLLPAA